MFFLQPSFVWALTGLLMIGSEMFMPGFVIFFFGMGAISTAFLSAIIIPVGGSLALQVLIFALSSIFSLVFLRKRFAKVFRGSLLNPEKPQFIDQEGEVLEAITADKPGRVKFNGTSWKAVSYKETFEPGDPVEILEQDGLTLVVCSPILREDSSEDDSPEES